MTAPLLVATVAAVGVLHTLVPDHWAPLVVIGRQQGWSVARTARAAAIAGFGHVASTLVLGVVLWAVGASLAAHYGHAVNVVAAIALIGFRAWIGWPPKMHRRNFQRFVFALRGAPAKCVELPSRALD